MKKKTKIKVEPNVPTRVDDRIITVRRPKGGGRKLCVIVERPIDGAPPHSAQSPR